MLWILAIIYGLCLFPLPVIVCESQINIRISSPDSKSTLKDLLAESSETHSRRYSVRPPVNSSLGLADDVEIEDILKDLSSLSKPSDTDLSIAEANNPKRKIVGVKKHKNYEIVLYEYSDEEGLSGPDNLGNDFDTNIGDEQRSSGSNKKSQRKRKHKSSSHSKHRTTPAPTDRDDDDDSGVYHDEESPRSPSTEPPVLSTPSKRRRTKPKTTTSTGAPERNDRNYDYVEERGSYEGYNYPSYDDPYYGPGGSDYYSGYAPEDSESDPSRRRNPTTRRPKTTTPGQTDYDSIFGRPGEFEDNHTVEDDDEPTPKTTTRATMRIAKPPRRRKNSTTTTESPRRKPPTTTTTKPTTTTLPTTTTTRKHKRVKTTTTTTSSSVIEDISDEDESSEDKATLCKDPTGKTGQCQEYFKCSAIYSGSVGRIKLKDYKCTLPNKQIGICCPVVEEKDTQVSNGKALMQMFSGQKALTRHVRKLIRSNVNSSLTYGLDSIVHLDELERDLLTKSIQVRRESAAGGHNRFFPTSKKIRQVSDIGFELLQTSNDLSDRLQLTNEIGGLGLKSFKSSNVAALRNRCPALRPCGINKYRKIDGSCNNLRQPKMGQSLTPLSRVLEPAYADGRWEPRISKSGLELPSARLLSQMFIHDRNNPDSRYTLNVMQFGQFLDHDITSVPIFTFANNSGISCCENGQFLPIELQHPNCFPIEIPANDPFYSRFGQRCMNFVRSRIAPRIDCSLGYADQMNALTHWIDLSNVYGSTESELQDLRLYERGLLQFSELADRKMLLPLKPTTTGELDYKAGDDRVNEMQGLMVMHLIWFREHNRLALELARINPYWNDEELFQEARRIAIAEYQHIIYNEWLPVIIGREYMSSYGILPLTKKGFFKGYDPEIDASIENSFSTAGFRMGHTLVQGIVRLINEFGQDNERVSISNHAENAEATRAPNQIDKWIRGLSQQPIQSFDPFVTQQLNGKLFKPKGEQFGMDLSSLNIQRARDHGIPGYNAFRELCQTGKKAKTFDDFRDWIAPEIIAQMRRVYDHPDDVDLWIGGISETPLVGALIGPTFTCIVGDQFARSKKGDRYFYDLGDQTHSFSPEQLKEIRKASFARILCDNGDNLESIQPSAFLQPDFDFNSLVDCRRSKRIPRINLRLWENEPTP